MLGAAVASAVALAACFLLVVRPWDNSLTSLPGGPVGNIPDQVLQSLADVLPAQGEAIVLRLHVNKDAPLAAALDAALAKAGIGSLASDISTGAAQWQDAYRQALESKYGSTGNAELLNSTVAAAEAVFVEAPLAQLDGVINDLTTAVKQPLAMSAVTKLALNDTGEGEFSAKEPFAQKLNASLFRLEKKLAQAANVAAMPPPAGKAKPQQTVRVLILFESE
jgi:hypothetical protein